VKDGIRLLHQLELLTNIFFDIVMETVVITVAVALRIVADQDLVLNQIKCTLL
jgi:hypothetical protein